MPGESITITAPLQGTVVQVPVAPGDVVAPGEPVVIIESMKMEHVVRSPGAGSVLSLATQLGDLVSVGDALALIETSGDPEVEAVGPEVVDLDAVRPDLAELHHRRSLVLDAGRPEAVDRRHASGRPGGGGNIDNPFVPHNLTQ